MSARPRLDRVGIVVVTDGSGEPARIDRIARSCLDGGVRAVQLREPSLMAAGLARTCERLMPAFDAAGAWLLVNDRADVAAAGLAHGVHLGRRSLSPSHVRRFLPPGCLLGVSAHDEQEVDDARGAGADYVFLSPVFATRSKPDAEPLGVERATRITERAGLPVVWLGGFGPATIRDVPEPCPASGIAVMSAVCGASDPREAAADLVSAWRTLSMEAP